MDFGFHRGTTFQKIGSYFLSTRVIDSSCRYSALHPTG
nr:MAG TPA: hypothetical protein [Caudoviricetes sp.]